MFRAALTSRSLTITQNEAKVPHQEVVKQILEEEDERILFSKLVPLVIRDIIFSGKFEELIPLLPEYFEAIRFCSTLYKFPESLKKMIDLIEIIEK